jgi:hypothetical protein
MLGEFSGKFGYLMPRVTKDGAHLAPNPPFLNFHLTTNIVVVIVGDV